LIEAVVQKLKISTEDIWSALRFKPVSSVARKGQYRTNQPVPKPATRLLEIPDYLQELLNQHPSEKNFFESLAYTHRKEYLNWIIEARKPETRQSRLEKMLEMLKEGRKGR
jgi:uncharacterized protein YdeI (YjbR/CyaY-like superfamily)